MRRIVAFFFLGLLLVIVVLPALIVKSCRYSDTVSQPSSATGLEVRVLVHATGEVVTLPLEEYVAGVVAAEMPASFGLQALEAQAVIARTFAARRIRALGGQGVPGRADADVTTDIWSGGQAWMSQAEARKAWGPLSFYGQWQKVEEAVAETSGLILTYEGVPIEAAYHSTCGGATESSEDVWQEALPYLRGVDDPWCRASPWMQRQTDISIATMEKAFGLRAGVLAASAGQGRSYLAVLDQTPSGRAKLVRIGEKQVTGPEFRRLLGLESARFNFTTSSGIVHFVTSGYGHGVGLCQYGANGLSQAGKSFREILDFYYTGATLEPIQGH